MWSCRVILFVSLMSHLAWPFDVFATSVEANSISANENSEWTPFSLFEWWQIPEIPASYQMLIHGTYLENPDIPESTKTTEVITGFLVSPSYVVNESRYTNRKQISKGLIRVRNPSYEFSIERIGADRWVLQTLDLKSTSDKLFDFGLRSQWGLDIGVRGRLNEPGVILTQLPNENWNNESVEVLEVSFPATSESRYNPLAPNAYPHKARIYISQRQMHWPVRIDYSLDFTYQDKNYHRDITVAFENWQNINGQVVPLRKKVWSHGSKTIKHLPSSDCLMDISNWDAPFPKEQAYLTYYGLPEPEGISRGMSWWWAVIVALGLGVIFFWRKLKT